MLRAAAGQITLVVGNLDATGADVASHSSAQSVVIGTYEEGTTPVDLGWYRIAAVVTTVDADKYQAAITLTRPDLTTATVTYVDSGPARYTTASPAGFHAYAPNGTILNVDNFRIGSIPIVQFDATQAAGPGTVTPASLTVSLSGVHSQPVTVTFAHTGGTAAENVDFLMPATSTGGMFALKRSPGLTDSTRLDASFATAITNGSITVITGPDAAQDTDFWTNTGWAAQSSYCNYGARPSIQFGSTFFLSKFDVAAIPAFAGSTINKAQLRLYYSGGNTGINNTSYVTSSDWIEGTQNSAYPGAAGGASFAHPMGRNTNQNQDADGGTAGPLHTWANNDWLP